MYDFSRSFIGWTSTRIHHSPRMQVDAVCRIVTGGTTWECLLSAPCAGETMYAPRDLIQRPPYDFVMIYSPAGEFMFAKTFADPARNVIESHRVGEAMSTHDGRGAPLAEMSARLAPARGVRELTAYADIRAAVLGSTRLNGQTEFTAPDGSSRVVLEYPIKTCNVSHAAERWQIDAGPVLIPDLADPAASGLSGMRPGYVVFNDWTWAEFARRRLTPADAVELGSAFSAPARIDGVRNRIYSLE